MPQRSAQVHLPFSGDNNGGIDLDWVKKKTPTPKPSHGYGVGGLAALTNGEIAVTVERKALSLDFHFSGILSISYRFS